MRRSGPPGTTPCGTGRRGTTGWPSWPGRGSRWDAYRRLLAQGWTDAIRHLYPTERVYTFWNYFRGAWGRNAGLRIDHLLLNPAAARRLAAAGVDRHVRGWEKASDHAPAWVELRDRADGSGRVGRGKEGRTRGGPPDRAVG